ncbi:phage holin family protein [Arthrobacter sp. MYb227]|uniref:phage holin family protein n=1 Tax=Arthrobacter sp. MYb227 TaxID=1848601 RepID=UPI0015E309F4|nr:phage holin family protein [Arthrobacter sp. MYb227]
MSGTEPTGSSEPYTSTPRTIRGQVGGLRHLVPSQLVDEARIAANILKAKGINVGVAAGAGILAVVLLSFMVIALVVALIMGLGTVMAPWLAALIVAAGFLVLALILVGFSVWRVKSAMPLVPAEAIRGFRHDLGVLKDGSAFDTSTLDEPRSSRKKDAQETTVQAEEAKPKAPKLTHDELIARTRERREQIALHRDALGVKLEVPMQVGEKISDATQAAGEGITKAATHVRHFADSASVKLSEGVDTATEKLAEFSNLEGENAKEALRERWQPLTIMAGSLAMFFIFVRKLFKN